MLHFFVKCPNLIFKLKAIRKKVDLGERIHKKNEKMKSDLFLSKRNEQKKS